MDVVSNIEADPAKNDLLVLVDEQDREVGSATKIQAHAECLLHRAFSVVLVQEAPDGFEVLLSRRAEGKYHSGGLWANSCCSHPRVGEQLLDAAYRRVREELGCEAHDLREAGSFVYCAVFDDGISEHEFDHVLVGRCSGTVDPNLEEASEVRWISIRDLREELETRPEHFAVWAPRALSIALDYLEDRTI